MPRPKSRRAVQAELYSLSADLLAPTDGLSAEYLATQALDIFGLRILPSDHLVASFVAYNDENRSNDHLYLAAQQSDDDFLGTTFSYCPTLRQLAVSLNV
jgi:hypothetical protein